MHLFKPNDHLATTSNWHSYPSSFWLACPNCDFTDYHQYVDKANDPNHFYDTASATNDASRSVYQTKRSNNINKPVIRGETGFTDGGTQPGTNDLLADTQGIWLHKFLWGQVNPGGMLESYWYENIHIYNSSRNYDHRPKFKAFYAFLKDIPLTNGHYVDAAATTTNAGIWVWGQKDVNNKRAHLWVANSNHTWKIIVDGISVTPISGRFTVSGFAPATPYKVEWWDTYTGTIQQTETTTTDNSGKLTLSVSNLTTDLAIKIGDYPQTPSPTRSPMHADIIK